MSSVSVAFDRVANINARLAKLLGTAPAMDKKAA